MHEYALIIILIILFIFLIYFILNLLKPQSIYKGGAAPLEIDNEIGTCEYLSLLNSIFNSPDLVEFIFEEFEEHDTLHTTENFNILTEDSIQKIFNFWVKDPFKYINPEPVITKEIMNNHKVIPVLIGRILYFAYMYPHSTKEYNPTGELYRNREFTKLRLENSAYRNMYSFILGRLTSVLLYAIHMINNENETYEDLLGNISKMQYPNTSEHRLLIESLRILQKVDIAQYNMISSLNPREVLRDVLDEMENYSHNDKYIFMYPPNAFYVYTRLLNDKYYKYYVYLLRACADLFIIHNDDRESFYITFCSDVELTSAPNHSSYYDIPNNLHADNGDRGYLPIEYLLTLSHKYIHHRYYYQILPV